SRGVYYLHRALYTPDLPPGVLLPYTRRWRSRRLRIGGDGHRGCGRRDGLMLLQRPRRVALCSGSLLRLAGVVGVRHFLKLQTELHRWIEEAFDRGERDGHAFGDATERYADLEPVLGHLQVPELMLEHDCHLFRILRAHAGRKAHALGAGVKRNIEMMLARQTILGGVHQHLTHDAAQGVLGQDVVADVIDSHG